MSGTAMRSAPTARSEVRRTERAGRGNQIARVAGREHTQSRRSALPGVTIPLASDRPCWPGPKRRVPERARSNRRSMSTSGSTFRDLRISVSAGLVIPYFIPSIGATVGDGQKRSATETPGSGTVRDWQGRSEAALKRLLIRRFWVRNQGAPLDSCVTSDDSSQWGFG